MPERLGTPQTAGSLVPDAVQVLAAQQDDVGPEVAEEVAQIEPAVRSTSVPFIVLLAACCCSKRRSRGGRACSLASCHAAPLCPPPPAHAFLVQGVPSVARAAAVTGITDRGFLEALAGAATRALPHLSASDICSVVESFSGGCGCVYGCVWMCEEGRPWGGQALEGRAMAWAGTLCSCSVAGGFAPALHRNVCVGRQGACFCPTSILS
jgi:hypothetical protein